ncbi:hypothetical protein PABG_12433 [Paracoccidioides brasiliensis Pb03]|nr:hypothetical protein PABG_12433 [Paracoccidioides brasiliensis Pb03]
MEEIRSRVGSSKNKKKDVLLSIQANAANPFRSESHSNTQPGAYCGRDLGDLPACPVCNARRHGICWLAHRHKALEDWLKNNANKIKDFNKKKDRGKGKGNSGGKAAGNPAVKSSVTDDDNSFQTARPKTLSFCATCVKARQRRAVYKNSPLRHATRKALKIWVDIFGGGETLGTPGADNTSYAGKKLAMVITDDATRMRWIFALIGAYPPLYSLIQDGVSERSVGLIIEKARSLLLDSSAPDKMWGEAVIAATELLNLMPTSTTLYNGSENPVPKSTTPYEAWLGPLLSARGIRR